MFLTSAHHLTMKDGDEWAEGENGGPVFETEVEVLVEHGNVDALAKFGRTLSVMMS